MKQEKLQLDWNSIPITPLNHKFQIDLMVISKIQNSISIFTQNTEL